MERNHSVRQTPLQRTVEIEVTLISLPWPICNMIICFQHHQNIGRVARTELTISLHSSLLPIALERSASCTPMCSVSSFGYILTGLPILAVPCLGSQSNTSLLNSSFLLKQCPAKRVLLLSLIIEEILGSLPHSRLIVGCVVKFKHSLLL